MQEPTEEEVATIKEKHPVITQHSVEVDEERFFVVVKPVSRPEWHRFQKAIADDNQRHLAYEQLLRSHAVWPNSVAIDDMLQRYPGLAQSFGRKISQSAGSALEAESKKL